MICYLFETLIPSRDAFIYFNAGKYEENPLYHKLWGNLEENR